MEVVGYRTHIAVNGETPDIIALKYYSDEFMASYILDANPNYNNVMIYEGGEQLVIPVFDTIESDETLAPWRRG